MKKTKRAVSIFLAAVLVVTTIALSSFGAGAVSKIIKNKGDFFYQMDMQLYDSASTPGSTHTYKIFAFNVNSKSAKTCNSRLYKYLKSYYNEDYKAYSEGHSLMHGIYGNTYKNGNILSIRQKVTGNSFWAYKAYNVSKKTGKSVSLTRLYKMFGYSKSSFYKTLERKQVKRIKAMLKKSPGLEPYAKEMIAYARSSESRKGLQGYLDKKGRLCGVAKLNTYVAAGVYEFIFTFSKK